MVAHSDLCTFVWDGPRDCWVCGGCGFEFHPKNDIQRQKPPLRKCHPIALVLPADTQKSYGAGTELKALLRKLWIKARKGCRCDKRAAIMDEKGTEWCRENLGTIVGWLKDEAQKRRLPFVEAGAKRLILIAIARAEKTRREQNAWRVRWAYGVTTVPSRRETTLPPTLRSLVKAGFDKPRLFIDGCANAESLYVPLGLPVTARWPAVRSFGNWMLALMELYVRQPRADYYAIFQDDVIACMNLREYLESCKYPDNGYWNLYTNRKNQYRSLLKTPGWSKSLTRGYGALGTVLDNAMARQLLMHEHMVGRFWRNPKDSWKLIDAAVAMTLRKLKGVEYVHNPSLVQHIGHQSTMIDRGHRASSTFQGEDWDALSMLDAAPSA